MSKTFEPLAESFSTADAESPELAFERGVLHACFRDWRERKVNLAFHDAVAFSWDEGDAALSAEHRDDAAYLVCESDWLRRHIEERTIAASSGHRHFKLCFNAVGVLQVIATKLEVLA